MISELHESGYRGKLWRHTTLKHVKALYSKNPNILRKSGGAFGDLPIVKAIIGCAKLDVVKWIYEKTNGDDKYISTWVNGNGQNLLHISANGDFKLHNSAHLISSE